MAREGLITVGVELDTTQADRSLKQLTERTRREFSKATSSLALPLGTITGEASQFQKSLEASNARVLAFGASAGAIYALQGAFRQLIKSTVDVEKQMAEINAVFQLGGQNLKKFSNEIFNIANSYGVAFSDASKAAAEFARQGLTVEETLKRTSAAVALARISGTGMEQSVSSLTSVLNTFIKESLDAEEVVNRLAAVDQSYAVSAGDLAEALSRVSSSATDANVSLNQTIALITSAKQITARTGSVIGNSFKTMFTRLQRPEVLEDLESVGVKVRDAQGKLRPMMEILKNLATAYDSLGSSQKSFISETVGGVYQINVLKAIMRDLGSGMSIVDGAMEAAANSTNFVQKRMEILNETISSQLIRTVNNLNQAFSNVGASAFGNNLKAGISGFNSLVRYASKASDTETLKSENPGEKAVANLTQGALKGVTNLISGPGLQLVFYTLLKLMGRLVKFIKESVIDLTGVNDKEKQRLAINESVANVLGKQTNLLKGLLSGQIDINAGANYYLETLKNSVNQARELQALYTRIGGVAMPQVSFNTNRRAADGYIPKIEKQEAAKGGYTAGRIVQLPIRNGANSMPIIANTAETIARVVSNGQPYDFINPPKNSEAGKKHRQQAIFQTGIDPYSLKAHSLMSGGFVPNLAPTQMGEGAFGQFFNLGKKIGGVPLGKKIFKDLSYISDKDISQEYIMAKALENINFNPLYKVPKTYGTLDRALKRRSIGKEVVSGSSMREVLDYVDDPMVEGIFWKMVDYGDKQMLDKGIMSYDLTSHNVLVNDKLKNFARKVSGSQNATRLFNSIKENPDKISQIASALARQGGQMSFIDPGRFEFAGASSGFVPNFFSPIANALARENRATGGRAVLSRHPLLATPLNPLGLAAIDSSSQGSAGEAIRQHAAMGQNLNQIRKAYTGKGFVPNLATDYDSPFSESKSGGMFGASTFSSSLFMAMALSGRETLKDKKPEWVDRSTSSGWLSNFASEGKRAAAEIRLLERELIKLRVSLVKGETVTGLGQTFSGARDLGKLEHVFSEVIKNKESISRPFREKRDEQESRLSSIGRWGAGGASVLGGFATQFAGLASPSTAAGVEEFTAGLTTAGQFLLTFPSQLGKIGAVSIAGGAAVSALDVWTRGIHNSRQVFEVANAKQQKLAAQIDSLSVSLNQYDSMIMDSSVSFDAIQKEQRKYRETISQMRETPEGANIANRLAVAPDTKSKMSLLMEDRKRISQQQEALAANEAVKEFGNSRRTLASNFGLGVNPLGYSNKAEQGKMESIVRGQASTTIAALPEKIKKSLMDIARSNNTEQLDRKLIMASMSSRPEEAKAAQDLIEVYKDLEKTVGKGGVDILKKQTLQQLESERKDNTPEMVRRRQKVAADNAAIQLTMDMAMNQAKTSQRTFVNTGALKAGNLSDIRAFNTQSAYNQIMAFGPNSIQARQNNAALYRMQYGERSVKTYEAATESRRIAADKDFKIEQIKTETSRGIMDRLTQNFDELIKNPEQYNKAQLQNAGVPMLENQQAALIDSLNKGVEKTIGQGNLNRFVGQNGALNMDKVIESISKNSGGNATIQSQIVRYLQSNNSVDILKSILDSNNKIVGIDAEALTEQEKNTNSLKAAIKELDFKQASNYMGGIKNLLDRNSRRTMERNLVRGVVLMERGRTAEARGFGAATFLQTMKEQNIPIDLSGRNRQSILMRRAWAIGEMGLATVQQQSAARVSGTVGRLTGFGGAASMGINEYGRNAGLRTAGAAMRAAFTPENEQMLQDSTRDIANYSDSFRQELLFSSKALQAFADDVTSTKDKWLKDLAASVAVQKESSAQQKRNADKTSGGPGGGREKVVDSVLSRIPGDTISQRAAGITGQFSSMGLIATIMGGGAVLKGLKGGFRGAQGAFGGFKEARGQGQGFLKSLGTSLLGLNRGTEESKMATQAAEKYIAKTVEEGLAVGGIGGGSGGKPSGGGGAGAVGATSEAFPMNKWQMPVEGSRTVEFKNPQTGGKLPNDFVNLGRKTAYDVLYRRQDFGGAARTPGQLSGMTVEHPRMIGYEKKYENIIDKIKSRTAPTEAFAPQLKNYSSILRRFFPGQTASPSEAATQMEEISKNFENARMEKTQQGLVSTGQGPVITEGAFQPKQATTNFLKNKLNLEGVKKVGKYTTKVVRGNAGKIGAIAGLLALGTGSAFAGEGVVAPEQSSDSGLSMDSLKNFGLEAGMTTAMMKPGSTWKSAGKWGGGMAAANLGIGYLAENFGGKNADMISAGGSIGITAAMMKAGKMGKGLGVGMIASEGLGLIAGRAGNTSMLGQGAGLGASVASWAGTGAMIGSLIPGVGTAVGGAVGGTLGAVKHFASPVLSEEESQREKDIDQYYGQKQASKMRGLNAQDTGGVFKEFLGLEKFLKGRAGALDSKRESDEKYENRLTKFFGGGQFGKKEEKELNQLNQQLKSLDAVAKHAAKTGDTQSLIDAMKEIGDKISGAKEVSSQSKMMAEQKINVDISVKDSGAVSNELQQQLIAPLMEAFSRMQQEINELRTKPAPARI